MLHLQISSKRKVKRNFGTSKCGCFEGPLGNLLRTSWERPESTSQGRSLKVRLGRPLDVILGRPQDVKSGHPREFRLGRPRDGQIGPLGDVLGTSSGRPGDQYLPAGRFPPKLINIPAYFLSKSLF